MNFKLKKVFHSEADNTFLSSKKTHTTTRSLSGHLTSQEEALQQCLAAKRVPDHCRSVEKLHEFLPDCEKPSGTSQHLQVTQWMKPIDGKEKMMLLTYEWRKKNPPPPKRVPSPAPIASSSNYNVKKKPNFRTRAKEKNKPQNHTARDTESQIFNRMTWKMCFRWPAPRWNYRKKRKPD
ncbi:hypothetical protein O181_041934 [Austropuccinia psidii MF-1]|uniref:Uncharacterized protein n=1 Tax=Austropuccinia psidii MF-1 TaxID=1389203 RepID=A0A9Q3DF38_9BASI|nr:hypothetical protein [Austropuccinia psidii MF-1]